MMKQLVSVVLFLLMPVLAGAQTVENFRLPKNYIGRLDEILTEMGQDLNIRFVYDPATLQKYNTSLMTDNEKPLQAY